MQTPSVVEVKGRHAELGCCEARAVPEPALRGDRRFVAGAKRAMHMTAADIISGLMGGVLSCLTPETLLLFPLALAVAGGTGRANMIATAFGLGLSLVVTGLLAGSLSPDFGFEATLFRRIVCTVLVLQGIVLISAALAEHYPMFTGGRFDSPGTSSVGAASRRLLLALFIGANWIPQISPTLVKASLMAADIHNSGLALLVLFAFGVGAAIPWILLGRVLRYVLHRFADGMLHGMAGQRLLGVALIAVAILGSTGLDVAISNLLNPKLPHWAHSLSVMF